MVNEGEKHCKQSEQPFISLLFMVGTFAIMVFFMKNIIDTKVNLNLYNKYFSSTTAVVGKN